MKNLFIIILYSVIVSGCYLDVPCRDGLEKQPMYGRAQKCKRQIAEDKQFIEDSEKQYGSRKEACEEMLRSAWKNYSEGNLDIAMERFNQSWLLDSLNTEIYMGFANILSDDGKFEESLRFIEKSLKLDPQNSNNWQFLGLIYENLYFQKKDKEYLSQSIEFLKKSVSIKPDNSLSYAALTEVYNLANMSDSARKYMQITDNLNPNLIKPELREKIRDMK